MISRSADTANRSQAVTSDVMRGPAAARLARFADDTATWLLITVLAAFYSAWMIYQYWLVDELGVDAHAYWTSGHSPDLYGRAPGTRDAFLYSPAFAQLVRPLTWLPAAVFVAVWIAGAAAIYLWLLRPLGRWAVPALALCSSELCLGNVYALYALTVVVGFARPWAWAFPSLTKIVPGAQGVLWFALRREWRAFAIAAGASAAVAAASFVIWPHAWLDWARFLLDSKSGADVIRFAAACVATSVGALTGRRWLLPVGVGLACPMFNWTEALALAATLPRLLAMGRAQNGMPQPRQGRAVSFHQTTA